MQAPFAHPGTAFSNVAIGCGGAGGVDGDTDDGAAVGGLDVGADEAVGADEVAGAGVGSTDAGTAEEAVTAGELSGAAGEEVTTAGPDVPSDLLGAALVQAALVSRARAAPAPRSAGQG